MVMGDVPVEAEVVVVGAGPGGYAAAFHGADLGLDVTLVTEEERLGGVCLLRGCIPSKTLLSLGDLIRAARGAQDKGVAFQDPELDLQGIRTWKNGVVDRLTGGLDRLADDRSVEVVHGRGRFAGPERLHVHGEEEVEVSFDHAILATGSRPIPLPPAEFGDSVWSSAQALEMEEIPESLLVVGGGYVGLELGSVYASLGSEVTLVEMEDQLLPGTDTDLVEPLSRRLGDLFHGLHLQTSIAGMEEKEDGMAVAFEGEDTPENGTYQRVLLAVGRRPNTEDMGLEEAGVELDEDGFVTVDAQRRSSQESILAVGDVTGDPLLAHKAMREGKVAAEVLAGEPAAYDPRAVPAVIYTDPQIAVCGLTEAEAAEEGREVQVVRFPWQASGRAVSMGGGEGFTKLLLEPDSRRVLGMGIVGPQAEALIAEGALAMEMGAVARDLALTVHPHPTLSETVQEAAEEALGRGTHV